MSVQDGLLLYGICCLAWASVMLTIAQKGRDRGDTDLKHAGIAMAVTGFAWPVHLPIIVYHVMRMRKR